jgi:hypothetical protein
MPSSTFRKAANGDEYQATDFGQNLIAGEPGSNQKLDAVGSWKKAVINATGATVVYSGVCRYGGFRIVGAAGALTMDVYDNTAASGQKVSAQISVAAALDGILTVGIDMDNGITVNLSGDPTDGQILVLYAPVV